MNDFKSPWWRRDTILTTEEKREREMQACIMAVIIFLVVGITGLYFIVHHVKGEAFEEGRTYERERIINLADKYHKEHIATFIQEMEEESAKAGKRK